MDLAPLNIGSLDRERKAVADLVTVDLVRTPPRCVGGGMWIERNVVR